MEQTERDIALTLQRDYFTFSGKKTTELSNKVPIYTGYISTTPYTYPNISWEPGSQVASAFQTLQQLLTQLSLGTPPKTPTSGIINPGIWPVQSIKWAWIQALYAFLNPAYAAWATTNSLPLPQGTSSWATAWNSAP